MHGDPRAPLSETTAADMRGLLPSLRSVSFVHVPVSRCVRSCMEASLAHSLITYYVPTARGEERRQTPASVRSSEPGDMLWPLMSSSGNTQRLAWSLAHN